MKRITDLKHVLKAGLFSIFLLMPLLSMAQRQKKGPEQKARMATDAMKTTCNLSDEQYKQVYQINLNFVNRTAALRSDTDDQMVKMGKMKLADDERDEAMKAVMDNEQYKAFRAWKEDRRRQMMQRMAQKN